jgi:uncharacterized protein (TIGR04255 family)
MKLPDKINPCPIVDCVIEIRFQNDLPEDAAFGLFYPALADYYSDFQKLPAAQLPEFMRKNDPALTYAPHYSSKVGPFVVRFGPRVISLANPGKYVGWQKYRDEFGKIFDKIKKIEALKNCNRVGVRYIDRFDTDIFPNLRLKIYEDERELKEIPSSFACTDKIDDIYINFQAANNVEFIIDNKRIPGSVLDIDAYVTEENSSAIPVEKIYTIVDKCHLAQKEKFFSIITDDFLQSLNPTGEEEKG